MLAYHYEHSEGVVDGLIKATTRRGHVHGVQSTVVAFWKPSRTEPLSAVVIS